MRGEIISWLTCTWWKGPLTFLVLTGLPITITLSACACLLINGLEEEMVQTATCILGEKSITELES